MAFGATSALSVPASAGASGAPESSKIGTASRAQIPTTLGRSARMRPNRAFRVIVQARPGYSSGRVVWEPPS